MCNLYDFCMSIYTIYSYKNNEQICSYLTVYWHFCALKALCCIFLADHISGRSSKTIKRFLTLQEHYNLSIKPVSLLLDKVNLHINTLPHKHIPLYVPYIHGNGIKKQNIEKRVLFGDLNDIT